MLEKFFIRLFDLQWQSLMNLPSATILVIRTVEKLCGIGFTYQWRPNAMSSVFSVLIPLAHPATPPNQDMPGK